MVTTAKVAMVAEVVRVAAIGNAVAKAAAAAHRHNHASATKAARAADHHHMIMINARPMACKTSIRSSMEAHTSMRATLQGAS